MNLTVEISMYPLQDRYLEAIDSFIDTLQGSGLTLKVNAMSTQIQGPAEVLWPALGQAITKSYSGGAKASFVVKVIGAQLDLDYTHKAG